MTMSARVLGAGGALLGLLVYAGWPAPADGTQRPEYDVVITNGLVLDGSGQAAVRADVAIRDGLIAAVGALGASASASATETIDAAGRYVTPGFIDVHSHAAEGLDREGLEQGRPLIAQGITTIVANPDGGGPITRKSQRETLEKKGLGPNVALLIGHGSVRNAVLGMSEAAPNDAELDRMKSHRACRDGRRRVRIVERPVLRARQLREDRRGDRARESRLRVRRPLHESHPRRGRLFDRRRRRRRRSDPHRRRRRRHRHRQSHESAGTRQLGQGRDAGAAHRGGAQARREGVRRSISLRRLVHQPDRRGDSALGAGRRQRSDEAAHRRRTTRARR